MTHTILFTGHMIDKPDRLSPRFSPGKVEAAAEIIRRIVEKKLMECIGNDFPLQAISAAACGGDILFQEICLGLGIPGELYLAIPAPEFAKTSVSFAGPGWDTRFSKLITRLPVHILYPDATADAGEEIWEDANQWMLDTSLKNGGDGMTLIALWDGKKGDGKGGVEHMIRVAKEQQATIEIIDTSGI